MKKLIYSSLLLLLIAVTFSCKKTEDDKPNTGNNNNTQSKCYVTKITDGPDFYQSIVYNAAMQAERMNFISDGDEEMSYRFSRDNAGKITLLDLYEDGTKIAYVTFQYNTDNTLNKAIVYALDGGVPVEENRLEFEYNAAKQITNLKQIDPTTNMLDNYTLLTYDTKGNVIKEERHWIEDGQDVKGEIVEFEYDDKKNPQLAIGLPLFIDSSPEISQNNVTKATTKDTDGAIRYSGIYTYEYNAEGYPKSAIYTSSGDSDTSMFEYICK